MSDYTTEAEVSVGARRRRRTLITIGVVLLALFFAFWYALSYYQADSAARAGRTPAPTCVPYDPDAVTPAQVKLNVYNASSRTGLAGTVAKELAERGFDIGKVANDPTSRTPPTVAEIRFGPAGKATASLVRGAFPDGTKTFQDKRKDTSVDVALGAKYTRLVPVPSVAATPMCPAPTES
ncbi:LytR C-terminal domain-containing protein [Oryzobacter telluris]|uniref:LytR C-terminal domain-containing protein n=1 Tax=Oryzobacter telluris TaxID=3149179 RepID=UPI00370DCF90